MGAFGIAVLPLLQFWLSRAAAQQKHVTDLRSAAYTDYLRAVAASSYLNLTSDEDLVAALRAAADAKARIAVYGAANVIDALTEGPGCSR